MVNIRTAESFVPKISFPNALSVQQTDFAKALQQWQQIQSAIDQKQARQALVERQEQALNMQREKQAMQDAISNNLIKAVSEGGDKEQVFQALLNNAAMSGSPTNVASIYNTWDRMNARQDRANKSESNSGTSSKTSVTQTDRNNASGYLINNGGDVDSAYQIALTNGDVGAAKQLKGLLTKPNKQDEKTDIFQGLGLTGDSSNGESSEPTPQPASEPKNYITGLTSGRIVRNKQTGKSYVVDGNYLVDTETGTRYKTVNGELVEVK